MEGKEREGEENGEADGRQPLMTIHTQEIGSARQGARRHSHTSQLLAPDTTTGIH